MQTYPYALARELTDWIHQHRKDIRAKLQTVENKEEFMTKTIKSPLYLLEVWEQLLNGLNELKAPAGMISEAREVQSILQGELQDKAYSSTEQAELLALMHPVESAKTPADKQSAVEDAIRQGKLSKSLGDKLLNPLLIPHFSNGSQNNETTIPVILTRRFSWGACGFCGVMAMEFGPVVILASCAVCGLL